MAFLQIIPSLVALSPRVVSWEPTSDAMTNQQSLIKFGFKFGRSGAHDSRTMMLPELRALFACTQVTDERQQYREQITNLNCLDKPTSRARKLTAEHLVDLYGLSPDIPLFRVFRQLWDVRVEAQPLLALQLAAARDPLFRLSVPLMLELQPGESLQRVQTEAVLAAQDPNRFSATSLKSYAQNINAISRYGDHVRDATVSSLAPLLVPATELFSRMHANEVYHQLSVSGDDLNWKVLAEGHDMPLEAQEKLSQGQRQDLALSLYLARAKNTGGSFLLDEPIAHLDDLNRVAMLDIFRLVATSMPNMNLILTTASNTLARHLAQKFSSVPDLHLLNTIYLEGNPRTGVKAFVNGNVTT